jgi:hypothetical protein
MWDLGCSAAGSEMYTNHTGMESEGDFHSGRVGSDSGPQ